LSTALDLPEIEVSIEPTPSSVTPGGVEGIGEIPVGVAVAAVTSAVEDVLKRRIKKVPIRSVVPQVTVFHNNLRFSKKAFKVNKLNR
jgi:CO/xanthine dehydrogenase Mo-binding subunit